MVPRCDASAAVSLACSAAAVPFFYARCRGRVCLYRDFLRGHDGTLPVPQSRPRRVDQERAAMTDDRIPMTREGYDKLKAELDRLRSVEMIEVTKRVAAARDMGDLSENAEYHAAREDQGILQARINDMSDRLARAVIVDPGNLPKDTVAFGSKVQGHGSRHRRGGDLRTGRPGSGKPRQGPHPQLPAPSVRD